MARSNLVRRVLRQPRQPAEADVILIEMYGKRRPAIVLRKMPRYRDMLVCAVSTQLQQYIEKFDEIVEPSKETGITKKSVIRLGSLQQIESNPVPGIIGRVPAVQHRRLLKKLSEYLTSLS